MKRTIIRRAGAVLALAGMSAFLSGCDESWSNWFETETVYPKVLVAPNSAAQLTSYIAQAKSRNMRVRMTGHGHAISDIAITTDVLLTPDSLNKPLSVDRTRLKNPSEAGLMRVQSGIKVADLNTWLDKNGRALFNMGGYDGQTLAGVMMTATHGSGLNYGPIADSVASLQVVVDGGKMVQIEPANGITNPVNFRGTLEEDSSIRVQLIQDDDAFNAARVAIGSIGVVYAITLRTDQKYWLREVRHKIKWSELKKPGGYLERAMNRQPIYGSGQPSPEHWELQYSPYPDANGDRTFLITDRYRSYTPLPEQSPLLGGRGALGTALGEELIVLFGTPLAGIVDLFPSLAPSVLDSALNQQVDDNYTNVSYKVFNIGNVNNAPANGIEASFRLDQTVAAIERSFTVNDALYAQGIPMTGPIAVRFVKQSSGLIAMQQGRDTMFIEVIVLRDGKNANKLLKTHQQTYIAEFASRPHWGLDLNSLTSDAQVAALYPDTWARWKTQFRRFNPSGTFDGKVTDRLHVSVRQR